MQLDFGAAVVLTNGLPQGKKWQDLSLDQVISTLKAVDRYQGPDEIRKKALKALETIDRPLIFDVWNDIRKNTKLPSVARVIASRKAYALTETVEQFAALLDSTNDPAAQSELMGIIDSRARKSRDFGELRILYNLMPDKIPNPDKIDVLRLLSEVATNLAQAGQVLDLARQLNPAYEDEMLGRIREMVGQP